MESKLDLKSELPNKKTIPIYYLTDFKFKGSVLI